MNPRQRLAAWVRLLVLSAAYPERGFAVATVGRGRKRGRRVTLARLPRSTRRTAHEALEELIALYDEGLREPLPIYSDTTAAYAEAVANDGKPRKAGAASGSRPLRRRGPRPRAPSSSSAASASSEAVLADGRFAALAHRLWDRLLAHEHLEDR